MIDNLKEAVVAAKKIEEQDVVFLMDRFGYAKIVDTSVYERNKEAQMWNTGIIFMLKKIRIKSVSLRQRTRIC